VSGKNAKKIRKELKQMRANMQQNIAHEVKSFLNNLPFKDRVKIALRIIRRRF
jgi:hypothetical protein